MQERHVIPLKFPKGRNGRGLVIARGVNLALEGRRVGRRSS